MKLNNKELKGLLKSFLFAFRGLWYCIKNERNMRIHLVSSVLVLLFAHVYGLDATQLAILVITLGLVLMCEAINTSIEAFVDLGAGAYDNLARIAKDVAAGAVLISALASVGVGIALFLHPDRLLPAFMEIITNPLYFVMFLVLAALGLVFIFRGFHPMEHKEKIKIYDPKSVKKKPPRYSIDKKTETKIYKSKKN